MRPRQILNKLRTYPDEFYSNEQEKSSAVSFIETPIGGETLVPERLANQQKAWKASKFSQKKKKKTLVLADWTLKSLDKEELEKVKQAIDDLLVDGFKVYIWQDSRDAIRLKRRKLNYHISQSGRIHADNNNHIIEKTAHQHNLSKDSIHVLDDYWLRRVTDPSTKKEDRELNIKWLMNERQYIRKNIYDILKNATPPVNKVINTKWSAKSLDLVEEVKKVFPFIPVKNMYQELELTKSEAQALLIQPDQIKLSQDEIKQVESAHFFEIETPYLNQFLLKYPLNKLHLTGMAKHAEYADTIGLYLEPLQHVAKTINSLVIEDYYLTLNNETNYPKLQNLELRQIEISEQSLLTLFNNANQLKSLNITNLKFPINFELSFENCLPALEHLQLSLDKNGSYGNLVGDLLINKNHLKSLTLDRCQLTLLSTDKTLRFPLLEDLTLTNCATDENTFTHLLSYSPNIKSLYFKNTPLINLSGNFKLANLTEITFENIDHTAFESNLASILNQTTQISTLTLLSCTLLASRSQEDKKLSNPSAVKNLRLIQCGNETVTLFLSRYHQLKSLHLELCSGLDFKNLPEDIQFPQLTELEIDNCEITDEELISLLKRAPNLKTLIINTHQVKYVNKELPTLHLPFLEKMEVVVNNTNTITKNDINSLESKPFLKSLISFLNTDNHIQQLNIQNFNISKPLNDISPHLSTLKKLHLHGSTRNELGYTLSYAKNLEFLELDAIKLSAVPTQTFPLACLNHLALNNCYLTADNFMNLVSSSPLLTLNIYRGMIPNELPETLTLPSLQSLTLTAPDISKNNFIKLIKSAPKLQYIHLDSARDYLKDDPELKNLLQERNIKVTFANSLGISWENMNKKPTYADPEHNPNKHLNTPLPKDAKNFTFKYAGENETKNQGMIIEKVSQYLTLTQSKYCRYIPDMQNGMCLALATLFEEKPLAWWDGLFTTLAAWKGDELFPKNLATYCDAIVEKYIDTYVKRKPKKNALLGEAFSEWLIANQEALIKKGSFSIDNPWHTISFKYENHAWHIYDPNFVDGYKKIDIKDMGVEVKKRLGNLILVNKIGKENYKFPKLKISDPNAFIRDGGLLVLIDLSNEELQSILHRIPSPAQLNDEDIQQGLLIRDVEGRPAWTIGLSSKNSTIRKYTNDLINRFASLNKKYAKIFAQSVAHFTDPKKQAAYLDLLCLPSEVPKKAKPQKTHKQPSDKIPAKDKNEVAPAPEPDQIRENIRNAIHGKTKKTRYEKQFETWENQPKQNYASPSAYYQHLVNGKKSKRLIKLASSADIEKLGIGLQKYCDGIYTDDTHQKLYYPTYYIHSPDDLVCSASYIEKHIEELNGKKIIKGSIQRGPGGPLDRFLKAHEKDKPVLIVNYDNFDADDLVRLNSLLDKHPTADGTVLPEKAIVIGLINPNKPGSYKGADFYSRFGKEGVETCPLSLFSIPPVPLFNKEEHKKAFPIKFFHAGDWKERLFGRWKMQDNNLIFQEGILEKALASGRPINLQNGPWNDPDFHSFWNRARELGYIEWEGNRYDISQHIFYQENVYNWKKLNKQEITVDGILDTHAIVLNPTTFGRFFNNHVCNNETKKLTMLPGFIEAHKGQALSINVTRQLTDDEWAMLLSECNTHKVRLHVHCAPTVVSLPKELPQPKAFELSTIPFDEVIESSDIDVTVSHLNIHKDWQVIDISECEGTDLLTKLDGKFDKKSLTYSFTESNSALLKALQKGENVILKGKFSPELADALAPLLLERQANKGEGKIILISNDTAGFNYLPVNSVAKDVIANQKQAILNQEGFDIPPKWLSDYSLSQLRAKLAYAKAMNVPLELTNNNPWQGLKGLSGGIKLTSVEDLDETFSEKIADQFILERQIAVNSFLAYSPYVFLTGLTGVGKSTFVEKHLAQGNDVLYLGEQHLKKWAGYVLAKWSGDKIKENVIEFKLDEKGLNYSLIDLKDNQISDTILWEDLPAYFPRDAQEIFDHQDKWLPEILKATAEKGYTPKSDGRKILFIDEANITQRQWSEFEGLFNDPPTILIDGILYPLTDQHKVIFAGNPLNYGGDRMMAPLFEQHGGALIFEPMPIEFIYAKILKPIFENTPLKDNAFEISKEILKLYEFLCGCSQAEVLISPRELQMIALLVLGSTRKAEKPLSQNEIMDVTRHYIIQVAKNLVPPTHIDAFNAKFPPFKLNRLKQPILYHGKDGAEQYLITNSREPAYEYLTDLIHLREFRRELHTSLNEAQLYGGLGAFIVEGEPATGKSELVFATLTSYGYKKGNIAKRKKDVEFAKEIEITVSQSASSSDKVFYHLPISMQLDQKIKYLKKAFDEGAIVVIDEINSVPMMERLLNELLMGKCDGKRPTHPGFMIIGTQNPVTMGGRYQPSAALKRRQTTANLPLYVDEELLSILEMKGLEKEAVRPIVKTYQKKLNEAKQFHLDPEPTLRVLEEVARSEVTVKHVKAVPIEQQKSPVNDSQVEEPLIDLPPGIKSMGDSHYASFWKPMTTKIGLSSNDPKIIAPADTLLKQITDIVKLSEWYNQTLLSLHKPTGIQQIIALLEKNETEKSKNKNNGKTSEKLISEIITICQKRLQHNSFTRTDLTNDFYLIFASLQRDSTNRINIDYQTIRDKLNDLSDSLTKYDEEYRKTL